MKSRENRVILNLGLGKVGGILTHLIIKGGVQFSCEIILGGYSFHTPHVSNLSKKNEMLHSQ